MTSSAGKNKKIFTLKHTKFSELNETNSQVVGVTPTAWYFTFYKILSHIKNERKQNQFLQMKVKTLKVKTLKE